MHSAEVGGPAAPVKPCPAGKPLAGLTAASALLAVAPAVAAAVTQATGAVIRDLPLTPERVWRALKGRPQSVPQTVPHARQLAEEMLR